MKIIHIAAVLFLSIWFLPSCKNRKAEQEIPESPILVRTTPVKEGKIEDYLTLNGQTIYLKKDRIVAPVSAYVTRVHVQYGELVKEDEVLFELQTRENMILKDSANVLELSAPAGGTVSELAVNQPGTYLMEGDLLCTLVENRDLVIQVSVPFEYHDLLKQGNSCMVILPDNTGFDASVSKLMPAVNETDQTQKVLLRPDSPVALPENLNLSVRFILHSNNRALLVPREAVMTNEKQTNFWLMRMIHDSLAVKVPIERGIANDSLVEVVSSEISAGEPVITTGAYGLPDSSIVKVIN
jgi:multidrug efflux pump subunit AcrA (membrane-fusion protein)